MFASKRRLPGGLSVELGILTYTAITSSRFTRRNRHRVVEIGSGGHDRQRVCRAPNERIAALKLQLVLGFVGAGDVVLATERGYALPWCHRPRNSLCALIASAMRWLPG